MTRTEQTTYQQFKSIIAFLEIPSNFNIINGKALQNSKDSAMGRSMTKISGFSDHFHKIQI